MERPLHPRFPARLKAIPFNTESHDPVPSDSINLLLLVVRPPCQRSREIFLNAAFLQTFWGAPSMPVFSARVVTPPPTLKIAFDFCPFLGVLELPHPGRG